MLNGLLGCAVEAGLLTSIDKEWRLKIKVLLQLRPWTDGFNSLKGAIVNIYVSMTLPGDTQAALWQLSSQPGNDSVCQPISKTVTPNFSFLLFSSLFGYGEAGNPQVLANLTNDANNESSINKNVICQRDGQKSGQRSLKHMWDQLILTIECSEEGNNDG